MKILLIDKNLLDPLAYKKWNLLSQKKNVELMGVTPARWRENYKSIEFSQNPSSEFTVYSLPIIWAGYENRGFYLHGLGEVLKKFRPEVFLLFEEPWSLFALQGWWLRKLHASNAKFVLHTWDNLSKGWRYPYRPKWLYSAVERTVLKSANLLIATNQEAADYFTQHYSVRTRKIYFGIDIEAYHQPLRPKRKPESVVVGYFGRLLHTKGVDTIIRSVKKCRSQVELLVVGDGPERGRLQDLVKNLDMSDRVSFVDGVASGKLPILYQKIDIFVLASQTTPTWKEQYGRVLIEAMAAGVPVIGSSSGAIPEIIGNGGRVFPEGDVEALAREIDNLAENRELRKKLRRSGRKRAEEFSARQFADSMYVALSEMFHERKV